MTLSTHTAIGALIGLSMGNPIAGFLLGVTSHFLLDMIPHGDTKISTNLRVHKKKKGAFTYGTIDAVIAVYLVLIFSNIPNEATEYAFSMAIIGSILPDLLVGLYDITKSPLLKPINDLHFFFHDFFVKNHGDIKLPTALFIQAIFILLIIIK
ncbi:MAG: hypothetical protein ABII18_06665 [bacterium]